MPQVVFRAADNEAEEVSVEARAGGALGDLCDEHDAPVPFSCRSATCGTCRVVVLEGAELFLPPEPDEVDLLAIFGVGSVAPFTQRLACQAKLRAGEGRVVIRAVGDDEP
jgi:2Fe-2S ferredoxin